MPNERNLPDLLPADIVCRYRVMPLSMRGRVLEVGVAEQPDAALLRDLAFLTGRNILPVIVESAAIDAFIAQIGDAARATPELVESKPAKAPLSVGGAVVQQVNRLIREAITRQASDIHIEPYEHFFRVRYRLDGILHSAGTLSLRQKEGIVARLKIMASLDIAEKRRPQDGRIRFQQEGTTVDLRLSTLPTTFGEKVVLRILDKSRLQLDLEVLGFAAADLRRFRKAIHLPYGMILVTGPTGSGKTTTLYAALNALNTDRVNITTVEDPIEYNLPGINQAHVRSDIGFTFAQALRAFLRQDPNIIMVGEMRDTETAQIAVRAALTGHLVLTTLHTNDAASSITRLIDMGVEPFLVASSVRMVVAQRLVRRICSHCKEEEQPAPALLVDLEQEGPVDRCHRGRGCEQCHGTGYRGRVALFEVMPVGEVLGSMIARQARPNDLRHRAQAEGMRSLRADAREKLYTGVTSLEEVLRETEREAFYENAA